MTQPLGTAAERKGRGPSRLVGGAETALRRLLGALMIAMVVVNVLNAAGRYLFATAISGSDELLVYAMVWLVFLGAVLVTRDRAHLSFDLWQRLLPPALVRAQRLFHDLLLLALAGFACPTPRSWSASC